MENRIAMDLSAAMEALDARRTPLPAMITCGPKTAAMILAACFPATTRNSFFDIPVRPDSLVPESVVVVLDKDGNVIDYFVLKDKK